MRIFYHSNQETRKLRNQTFLVLSHFFFFLFQIFFSGLKFQVLLLKIIIEHISGSTAGNVFRFFVIICLSPGLPKYIKTYILYQNIERFWPLTFTSYKAFIKDKKRSGTSLPTLFYAWFLKTNISLTIFYKQTKFDCLMVFTS